MRMNKFLILLCMVMISLSLISCNNQTDNGGNGNNETKENSVKIKSIDAKETSEAEVSNVKARMHKNRSGITAGTVDGINYIIIYKSQTDITFTITLDNPEAYGIDDIRITCDDADSQIWLTDGNGGGEWQPIRREADGTSVVGWDSSNRYERTYNIRTTSPDAINTFKVVDVRLAGHEKFQSKETGSTDMGNNELHIYKMDDDAFTLNVVENTFDYIKFNFNIKEEYKDIISNFEVKDVEYDEENEYWVCYESKEIEVEYDYYMEGHDLKIKRKDDINIKTLEFVSPIDTYPVGGGAILYNPTELELISDADIFAFSIDLPCPLYINIISYYDTEEMINKNAILAYFDIVDNGKPVQFDLYFCNEKLVECTNSVVYEWNGTERIEFKGHAFEYNEDAMNYYLEATDEGFAQSYLSWESQYLNNLLRSKCEGNFILNSTEIYFYDLFRIVINGEIYKFVSPYLDANGLIKVEE